MLVLESTPNPDIRKNDIKTIKILMQRDKCELPCVVPDASDDIKQQMRNVLRDITGTELFHLEQVYTLGDKKYLSQGGLDILHLAITNTTHINKIRPDYELVEISIQNNTIKIGNNKYQYKTIEKIGYNVEYFFETNATDVHCDKTLIEVLTVWKYLRSRLDNTDAIFKFMPAEFTPEDVRQVYEIISQRSVDKSNFHKRITKYCTEIPDKTTHRGHRPGKIYKFKAKAGDAWL